LKIICVMSIQLVVFDLAGTTLHDQQDVHRVLQSALAHAGMSVTLEQANRVMGIPKPVAIRELLDEINGVARDVDDRRVEEIHHRFVKQMVEFYTYDPSVRECAGVSATFQKLNERGIKVMVDTGFSRDITNAVLKRMQWVENGLVAGSVCSDEVPRGRPYPDMIWRAMELAGVSEVKHVAKVGDTQSDMEEGTAAGCAYVIGITTGAFARDQLLKTPHTHLISHIEEVLAIVS